MPFFIRNKGRQSGSKVNDAKGGKTRKKTQNNETPLKRKRKHAAGSEEINSDSEKESDEGYQAGNVSSSEEEEETAQEKRLRLAKDYLAQLEEQEAEVADEEEFRREAISQRLQQEVLAKAGKLHKTVAHEISCPSPAELRVFRGHQLSVTCLVISPDDKHIFSAGKDCSIIKWDIATGKKLKVIPGGRKGTEDKHKGHTSHVLCLAISSDGKYLASGDCEKLIHIWDPATCDLLHTFQGHRDAVSGLAFRKGSHQLFSGAHDRSVKIWNVDERAYVETLFGHQDNVTCVDSLTRERAISSGGRDGSLRIWKVVEESQLVFHGHKGCIDCVALINEEHFISGADDNSLAVWGVHKKKPLVTYPNAHSGPEEEPQRGESWITAVASLQHTDLVASGSKDGCVRLWCCSADFRSIKPVAKIPVVGFVNSLKFSGSGQFLAVGVGQEHRLGRWWRNKHAKNSVVIVPLPRSSESGDAS